MADFCISVALATSCCTRNYLESVCRKPSRVCRGRVYIFEWSSEASTARLLCNGVLIGTVYRCRLGIYPQFSSLGLTTSSLNSIMALFNLYPY